VFVEPDNDADYFLSINLKPLSGVPPIIPGRDNSKGWHFPADKR
jgi:hypothetical protein